MLTDQPNLSLGAAAVGVPPPVPSRSAWPSWAPTSQQGAWPPTERKRGGARGPLRLLVEEGRLKAQQEATAISPRNQELLRLLRDWMRTPDDLGAAWWEEFDRDLARNRLSFSKLSG